jgi:hypothetical protein
VKAVGCIVIACLNMVISDVAANRETDALLLSLVRFDATGGLVVGG